MRSLLLPILVLISSVPAELCAQTATMIESVTNRQAYTFANASGFSFANNGPLLYDGPINQPINQTTGNCCMSATLIVNGESFTVTPATYEADTGLKVKTEGGTTLSSTLSSAVIPSTSGTNPASLQYDVTIGGVIRMSRSDSYTLQEKVDSQSISIFPQFSPSVFP